MDAQAADDEQRRMWHLRQVRKRLEGLALRCNGVTVVCDDVRPHYFARRTAGQPVRPELTDAQIVNGARLVFRTTTRPEGRQHRTYGHRDRRQRRCHGLAGRHRQRQRRLRDLAL
ncbi:hypothetical protein [Streptomyces sp. NPDC005828]|uniref:hypothetical protein n=1 Tax=Streptomyces sp. NPDC005828 TaxID=3157071 RepID=UPI0033E7E47B